MWNWKKKDIPVKSLPDQNLLTGRWLWTTGVITKQNRTAFAEGARQIMSGAFFPLWSKGIIKRCSNIIVKCFMFFPYLP
jgi:hypothetical protein